MLISLRFAVNSRRLLIIAGALSIAACAGTHVKNVASAPPRIKNAVPQTIAVVVENDSEEPRKLKHRPQHETDVQFAEASLTDNLAKRLTADGLTVVPANQPADLVLHCSLQDVHSGKLALRIMIGYGAGKAALALKVLLIDHRTQTLPTLLSFDTDSTTGAMPGAGLSVMGATNAGAAAGSAMSVPGTVKRDLSKEIGETADHVDQELAKYFKEQGWQYANAQPKPAPKKWYKFS